MGNRPDMGEPGKNAPRQPAVSTIASRAGRSGLSLVSGAGGLESAHTVPGKSRYQLKPVEQGDDRNANRHRNSRRSLGAGRTGAKMPGGAARSPTVPSTHLFGSSAGHPRQCVLDALSRSNGIVICRHRAGARHALRMDTSPASGSRECFGPRRSGDDQRDHRGPGSPSTDPLGSDRRRCAQLLPRAASAPEVDQHDNGS